MNTQLDAARSEATAALSQWQIALKTGKGRKEAKARLLAAQKACKDADK